MKSVTIHIAFLLMVSLISTTSIQTIEVTSVIWYSNSKVICVKMESLHGDHAIFSPKTLQMSFSFNSSAHLTIPIGNHPCGVHPNENAMCGLLPDTIDSSSFLQLKALFGLVQVFHFSRSRRNKIESYSIHMEIDMFSSFGKIAALSMKNICNLHVDKCNDCQESCESVMEDNGKLLCTGQTPTRKEKTERLIPTNEEMPFNTNLMNVTGIAFPRRKVFCVVMKRPVHNLGNIFRFLRYLPYKTFVKYVDEKGGGGQILAIPNDNVCIGGKAMENEEETDAICANYTLMPKYLNTFQGPLIIQGFNLGQDVYTFEKMNFFVSVEKQVIIRDDLDPCIEQTDCLHSMCSQTCQSFVTNNNYTCKEDINQRALVRSNTDTPAQQASPSHTTLQLVDTTKIISTTEKTQQLVNSKKALTTKTTTSQVLETSHKSLPIYNEILTTSQYTPDTLTTSQYTPDTKKELSHNRKEKRFGFFDESNTSSKMTSFSVISLSVLSLLILLS